MKDKWWAIFWMVCIMSMASCEGFIYYNSTQYKIALLECQQNTSQED